MGPFFFAAFLVLQGPAHPDAIPQNTSIDEVVPPEQIAAVQQPAAQIPRTSGGNGQSSSTRSSDSAGEIILRNIWSDQKAIWTSPLHMSRNDAVWWTVFGGGTAALIATESRPTEIFSSDARRITVGRNVSRIGALYSTFPIAGAFYAYGKIHKDPHARKTGALGAEALLDSYIVLSILKVAAGRERPDLAGGDGRFFKGKNSFPSGHSMMSWSLASVVAHEYKGNKAFPVIAYSLASAVSIGRVAQQKHFPSDVIAGGAMGWFIGRYVFQHHSDSGIQNGTGSRVRNRYLPEIYPTVDSPSRTYSVSLAWNP